MNEQRKTTDWELIEREFRAGQLSLREIGRQSNVSEGAIRKRAKAENWERDLTAVVRARTRAKAVRDLGTHEGTREQRARTTSEAIEIAAERGVQVLREHRSDIARLRRIAATIAERLELVLAGEQPGGPCLGERESVGDLLEKLSRTNTRVVQLERQALSIDGDDDPGARRPAAELSDDELTALATGSGAGTFSPPESPRLHS